MQMILTKRQRQFLNNAKLKGYFTLEDISLIYATKPSRRDFLERLQTAKMIKDVGNHKFILITEELSGDSITEERK